MRAFIRWLANLFAPSRPTPPISPEDEPLIGDILKAGEILGGEGSVSSIEKE